MRKPQMRFKHLFAYGTLRPEERLAHLLTVKSACPRETQRGK
jgi:gamma-glutamylcyclotransferase (GGCT)/AIG2-like uncharacterized protein YtfP